jgi:hypothetical protein
MCINGGPVYRSAIFYALLISHRCGFASHIRAGSQYAVWQALNNLHAAIVCGPAVSWLNYMSQRFQFSGDTGVNARLDTDFIAITQPESG